MMYGKLHLDLIGLVEFQDDLTYDDFVVMFGSLASHLWAKFTETHRYNFLSFYKYLDNDNRNTVRKYYTEVYQEAQ